MPRRYSRKSPGRRRRFVRRKRTFKKYGRRRLPRTVLRGLGANTLPRTALVKFHTKETTGQSLVAQSDNVTFSGTDFYYYLNALQVVRPTSTIQAYAHDTYANIYSRYRVDYVKYKVEIVNMNSGTPSTWCVQMNDNTSFSTNTNAVGMQPYTQTKTVGAITGGVPKTVFRGKIAIRKLMGISKQMYQDEQDQYSGDLSTSFGTNPVTLAVLRIAGTSTQAGDFRITTDLWQYSRLWSPGMQAQS